MNDDQKDSYRLKNLIRYGPEDPNFSKREFIPRLHIMYEERLFELLHCASLANKMDLFFKLLPPLSLRYIEPASNRLITLNYKVFQEDRLEKQN